jgi:hypothetical protein
LRVARRELQYTSSAGSVSRRLKSFQTRLTSAHAEKEEDVNECVACDADLGGRMSGDGAWRRRNTDGDQRPDCTDAGGNGQRGNKTAKDDLTS